MRRRDKKEGQVEIICQRPRATRGPPTKAPTAQVRNVPTDNTVNPQSLELVTLALRLYPGPKLRPPPKLIVSATITFSPTEGFLFLGRSKKPIEGSLTCLSRQPR